MSERVPRKRAAFESPATLARPVDHDPRMPRPASTVAGSVLVLLRAAAGVVWLLSFAFGWQGWVRDAAAAFSGDASDAGTLPASTSSAILTAVVVIVGVGVLLQAVLGLLILRGTNWPRVLVMVISTLSICTSFVGWWVQGQEIRVGTTFLTLSLDILILLALSSRSSAAYARRHERR
jgi:hypothetical protein